MSLFPYDVSKYEIKHQLVHEDYISKLQTLLAQLILVAQPKGNRQY